MKTLNDLYNYRDHFMEVITDRGKWMDPVDMVIRGYLICWVKQIRLPDWLDELPEKTPENNNGPKANSQ